jgi:hypothetical protein
LGLVRKEQGNLRPYHLTVGASPSRPLLAGNRATPAIQHKLVEVLTPHELHHSPTQLNLPLTETANLGLETADLIVGRDPLTEGVANFVSHSSCLLDEPL